MPDVKKPLSVGILLYPEASPTLALLMRDVFTGANDLTGVVLYNVSFVSVQPHKFSFGPVSIQTTAAKGHYDYLVVAPFQYRGRPALADWVRECELIRKYHARRTRIATPCLGSLVLAKSGILDGVEATIHWAWIEFARNEFPQVNWNVNDMVCRSGNIVTSGGYLAAVDLILHLIAQSYDKKTAHDLGRLLLAESTREKQSIYATHLVSRQDVDSPFHQLDRWIEQNLQHEITVPMLAEKSKMSLRNFQRQFTLNHGVSPKSFIQLRRIEKAKTLLRSSSVSLECIVEKVGLTDVSSFRKLFRRETGLTPAEFRRRIK